MIKKLMKFIGQRKVMAAIIIILFGAGSYWGYKTFTAKTTPTSYVLGTVAKGTLIVSVSGSGQVSASNQIDIKPKASGDVVSVPVQQGQEIKTGAIIAQLNASTALKAVRDAKANLDSAKLALQKLQQPPDQYSLLQAQDAIIQANESKQTASDDLAKSYDDGFNTISNTFLDLPAIMSGLSDAIFSSTLVTSQRNIDYYAFAIGKYNELASQYKDDALKNYQTARSEYDQNFNDYKNVSRISDNATIEKLIYETYQTTKDIADAVKSYNDLIQLYKDTYSNYSLKTNAIADTQLASLSTYTGQVNSHASSLLSIKNTIESDKSAIVAADRTIAEKNASLQNLQAGTNPLDLQSQQLAIKQRENSLLDAQQTLADYTIRAPFDGILASVDVKKGDPASSATAIATLITQQQVAEISLNEVDAAKVSVGQKVTLTFDAISGLEIAGSVAQIDSIGTVNSGVVSYNVKITFDTQDSRIKPGMSVAAAVITLAKTDVLLVPNSAVKSNGNSSFVQMLDNPQSLVISTNTNTNQSFTSATPPRNQTVTVGAADDTNTEIISGLNEGDQIVVRTITASSSATASTGSNSSIKIPGVTGGGFGGGVRGN